MVHALGLAYNSQLPGTPQSGSKAMYGEREKVGVKNGQPPLRTPIWVNFCRYQLFSIYGENVCCQNIKIVLKTDPPSK